MKYYKVFFENNLPKSAQRLFEMDPDDIIHVVSRESKDQFYGRWYMPIARQMRLKKRQIY